MPGDSCEICHQMDWWSLFFVKGAFVKLGSHMETWAISSSSRYWRVCRSIVGVGMTRRIWEKGTWQTSSRTGQWISWTSRVHEFNLPTQKVFSVFWTKVALALEGLSSSLILRCLKKYNWTQGTRNLSYLVLNLRQHSLTQQCSNLSLICHMNIVMQMKITNASKSWHFIKRKNEIVVCLWK